MKARITTAELTDILTKNLATHRQVFEEAMEGWRVASIKWFNARVRAYKKGDLAIGTYFNLTRPEDHSKDYRVALQMLEMTEDDTLLLDENEFRQYVRDEWGWKKAWTVSNSAYSMMAATMASEMETEDD